MLFWTVVSLFFLSYTISLQVSLKCNLDCALGMFKPPDLFFSGLFQTNVFLVYVICFNETVDEKWCLNKTVRQSENDLERGFVKQ